MQHLYNQDENYYHSLDIWWHLKLSSHLPPSYDLLFHLYLIIIIIIIIIWGVSGSRQHSRRYITAEDKAALKIRHKA